MASNQMTRRYPLPPGRRVASSAVVSRDGRYVAFQLSRAKPDPQYDLGHPGTPSDLAVLDFFTSTLHVVFGVELAPKSLAGLTFSRNGRWLIIALNEDRATRLLLWRPGLDRPLDTASLPGAVLYNAPVLDVTTAGP